MLLGETRLEDLADFGLQCTRNRKVHVAFAVADAFDGDIVRLPAVAQQRQKFAIVVADGVERLAVRVGDGDDARAIVITL